MHKTKRIRLMAGGIYNSAKYLNEDVRLAYEKLKAGPIRVPVYLDFKEELQALVGYAEDFSYDDGIIFGHFILLNDSIWDLIEADMPIAIAPKIKCEIREGAAKNIEIQLFSLVSNPSDKLSYIGKDDFEEFK